MTDILSLAQRSALMATRTIMGMAVRMGKPTRQIPVAGSSATWRRWIGNV